MIPQHLHRFFWDIDPVKFNPAEYPQYVIGRLLEFGDQEAVRWLRGNFTKEAIEHVVRIERRLSRRSATFWALVCGIPTEQVAALVHPREVGLWPFH